MDVDLILISLGIIVISYGIILAVAKFSKKKNFILGDGFKQYVKGYLIVLCLIGAIVCGGLIVISFLPSFSKTFRSLGYDKITFLILFSIIFIINITGIFIGFALLRKEKKAYKFNNVFLIANIGLNIFGIITTPPSSFPTRCIVLSIFYFCMLIYFWHRRHLFVE